MATSDMREMRERYDAYWADHPPSGSPSADPRGPHHHAARHWPELDRLCVLGDARKVHVALRVTDRLVVKAENKERRDLYEIALIAGGKEISSEQIRSGDLDACAESLQPVLSAGFGE